MKRISAEAKNFVETLRKEDYRNAVFPFLFWLAGAVIVLCIAKDVTRVGLNWNWVAIRFGYLPVAFLSCRLSARVSKKRASAAEFAIWTCGSYILWFCLHFALQTGGFRSDYVNGVFQYFLGIALIPITRITFYGFLSLGSLFYFAQLSTLSYPAGTIGQSATNYVSFCLFAALIFEITSRIRSQKSHLKWQLQSNISAQEQVIQAQAEEISRAELYRAVTATTQMLAHDVRRPFSTLRAGLDLLVGATDFSSSKAVVSRLVPEVERSMRSVNALIDDVLDAGVTSGTIDKQTVDPALIVEAVLRDTFQYTSSTDMSLIYDFSSNRMAMGNEVKIGRVLSNILGNAVQATNGKGKIWLRLKDDGDFLEFCVGNGGSFIPAESIGKLFDPFFTKGKSAGTGLGLAIAKKIVLAHGGRIWCTSSKTAENAEGQVEFFFTIPAAVGQECVMWPVLPAHSTEYAIQVQVHVPSELAPPMAPERDSLLVSKSQRDISIEQRPEILVVDDNPFVLDAWEAKLQHDAYVHVAESPDAVALLVERDPTFLSRLSLALVDVHFDNSQKSGFDLGRILKAASADLPIFVISDGTFDADALAGAADNFIAKTPVSFAELPL